MHAMDKPTLLELELELGYHEPVCCWDCDFGGAVTHFIKSKHMAMYTQLIVSYTTPMHTGGFQKCLLMEGRTLPSHKAATTPTPPGKASGSSLWQGTHPTVIF